MRTSMGERFWRWGCCWLISSCLLACMNGTERTYREGAELYKKHCSNCHMDDGSGLEALYPPLAGADWLKQVDVGAACLIRQGLEGPMVVNGVEYNMVMPAQEELSAVEITNILNYIHNAWGNQRDYISLAEVEQALSTCSEPQ